MQEFTVLDKTFLVSFSTNVFLATVTRLSYFYIK